MAKVFIDGSAGTTGLRIFDRLKGREEIELITLPEALRKDVEARREALNSADIAFLCLPDAAAIEAVSLIENGSTAVIDTSTAHRTSDKWTYGFPEIKGKREEIKTSKRIANPGCHASGFIATVAPLVEAGVLLKNEKLSCFSLTGYSGGGKGMIAEYEAEDRSTLLSAPRQYALTQSHKHLKEMSAITGMELSPVFCPIVAPFYSGMEVTVPLHKEQLKCNIKDLEEIYRAYYNDGLVNFEKIYSQDGFLSASSLSNKDNMIISVHGNEDRIILTALYDNLGKGASGSAIQNMNILLGVDEKTGLEL